jgi:hypothetical protein
MLLEGDLEVDGNRETRAAGPTPPLAILKGD